MIGIKCDPLAKPPPGEWPIEGLERLGVCPVCHSSASRVLYQDLQDRVFFCSPGRWTLHQCGNCGTVYLDPRPNRATIGEAYRVYFTHQDTADPSEVPANWRRRFRLALRNGYVNAKYGYSLSPSCSWGKFGLGETAKREADRVVRHLRFPGGKPRLLDLGCGNGAYLVQMRAAGWDVCGLDPDEKAVEMCRKVGLAVDQGFLSEARFPEHSFEAITMSHVMEHLHDPGEIVRICLRILKPGGVLWLATPNPMSIGHARFGRHWFALDPPRHLVLFTLESLTALLRRTGFAMTIPPLASSGAKWLYRVSEAVARGRDPLNAPGLSFLEKWRLKREARQADRRADSNPRLAEELVIMAHKPAAERKKYP